MKKNRGHAWHKRKRKLVAQRVRHAIEQGQPRPEKCYVAFVHPSVAVELNELFALGLDVRDI